MHDLMYWISNTHVTTKEVLETNQTVVVSVCWLDELMHC